MPKYKLARDWFNGRKLKRRGEVVDVPEGKQPASSTLVEEPKPAPKPKPKPAVKAEPDL